jgi:hypothetical protein
MNTLRIGKVRNIHAGLGGIALAMCIAWLAVPAHAQAPEMTPLPAGASVRIAEPANGATVHSPVRVVFAVSGATVKPAGTLEAGTGHYHLLINTGAMPLGVVIPADATHIHFGKGQTETTVELKPGEYELTVQFADGLHRSYGPQGAQTIKIMVAGY